MSSTADRQLQEVFQRALGQHQRGELGAALAGYGQVLRLAPEHFDALHLSGVIAAQSNEPQRAVEWIDKALAVDARQAGAHFNRATALQALGRWEEALAGYDRAIALAPRFAEAYSNRGLVLQALQRTEQALGSFERAIALRGEFAEAHFNRAALLQGQGDWEAALGGYDRALALKEDYAQAWCNRGTVQRELQQLEAALGSYERAIALNPRYALAHCNRGNVLNELRRWPEALAGYDCAISIQADYAEAYFNKSLGLLARGDLAPGWRDYEWRWKNPGCSNFKEKRQFRQPLWLGEESIAGKTILLHAEQGLGDTIQFCRYAKLVAEAGARVILEVQPPLVALLAGLSGVSQVLAKGSALPDFDIHCPLMSLPLAFGTTLETIPSVSPYLRSDPRKVAQWRERLGGKRQPRIGLAWSGSVSNANDRHRSIALAELIAGLPAGFQYVSLHKEVRESDVRTLESHPAIVHFGIEQTDFSDAAALCDCMDLVISVDTSLAHLSAAMGSDTRILLSVNSDWRWLLDAERSPWYPTVRLYRQQRLGDWHTVFAQLAADLPGAADLWARATEHGIPGAQLPHLSR